MTALKQISLADFVREIMGVAERLKEYGVGKEDPQLRIAMATQITQLYKDGNWSTPPAQH